MRLRFRFEIKRALIAGVCILVTLIGSLRLPDVPIKFALVACALFAAAACLRLEVRGWAATLVMGLFACGTALLTVLLCQFVNDMRGVPRSVYLIFLGCCCFLLAALVLHLILLCVSRISIRPVVLFLSAAFLLLAVANRYTYEFRGNSLTPPDILSAMTAFNILGSYHLSLDKNMWYAIVFFAIELFAAPCIHVESLPRIGLRRISGLAVALSVGMFVFSAFGKITPDYWYNNGALVYGFVVNFSRELQDSVPVRPQGYSSAQIEALEQRYGAGEAKAKDTAGPMPHVIVIMNESLTDYRVFGELETSEPVTPFLDSLQENTIRGFALSSVYGGKTANSEYEFLTGNSMAFSSPSEVPFSMQNRPCYTLERYLESLGYDSYATHPERASNWNRSAVYPLLGFTNASFLESYNDAERINGWAKDEAVYDNLIRSFEASEEGRPHFLYAVTSQNHGPFGDGDEEVPRIPIVGFDSVEAGAYLGRLRESDRAFQKLVEYFAAAEEPVVILMYGDHHPKETPEMIRFLYGAPLVSLDERQLMYEIPYFIWANFDIEEQRPELSSINYLSTHLLEAAGLPLPPYNRFLKDVQETIPAINAFGYYSRSEGRFLTPAEAEGAEKQALQEYKLLQYNASQDKKGRSDFFFPIDN